MPAGAIPGLGGRPPTSPLPSGSARRRRAEPVDRPPSAPRPRAAKASGSLPDDVFAPAGKAAAPSK